MNLKAKINKKKWILKLEKNKDKVKICKNNLKIYLNIIWLSITRKVIGTSNTKYLTKKLSW